MRTRRTGPHSQSVDEVLERLALSIPDPAMELSFSNPFELLVATVLSAQTTDRTVNRVTPVLFASFPTPEALSMADPERLQSLLRPTGFFKRKAEHVRLLAIALIERFGGHVPDSIDALVTLPGVGRKTASVVMAHAFHRPAIAVDTHVERVSRRIGWTKSTDPEKVEQTLAAMIPKEDWIIAASRILLHGRYVCLARSPKCVSCTLLDICPSRPGGTRSIDLPS